MQFKRFEYGIGEYIAVFEETKGEEFAMNASSLMIRMGNLKLRGEDISLESAVYAELSKKNREEI